MKCMYCGAEVFEHQTVCLNCGNKLPIQQPAVQQPYTPPMHTQTKIPKDKKFTALILALGFGYLGAHCFYLGEKKKGIARLVCLLILPVATILYIYDIIRIISGTYVCDPNAVI